MGSALAEGLLKAGLDKESLILADVSEEKLLPFRGRAKIAKSNREAVKEGDVVVLAVKPKDVEGVVEGIKEELEGKIAISIAAGLPLARLQSWADARWVRAMPNIGCRIGMGFIALAGCKEAIKEVRGVLEKLGKVREVEEWMMDAITALSGSGPAFAFLLMDALADGGVLIGLPKEVALEAVAQTFLGASALLLSSKRHPLELKDDVCSPGGTTIAGIKEMEEKGTRGTLMEAVRKAYERAKELSGEGGK